jgi:mRNA-degrading endonuclease RelE of RelBE toxin-antitoxin system
VAWHVDFTSGVRADLVGLEPDATEAVTDTLVTWLGNGPPRENRRVIRGIDFYETVVAERYLLAYVVDDDRQRFVVLWLRHRPSEPVSG